jgi:glycosyltransferase involved in cell wall biosynthesis
VKILFVYSYLTLGGVETVLRARLDGLARWGIEAHSWFFHDLGGRSVFAGREERIHVGEAAACLRFAAQQGFDLLSSIDTPEAFFDGKGRSPRLIVECHSPYLENIEYLRRLAPFKPGAVFVPSEHQRRVVLERTGPGVDVRVVPNPLRQEFTGEPVPFASPPRRPVVAWIGRLDGLKNWQGFLELGGALLQRRVDAELWIAGKPVEAGVAGDLLDRARTAGVLGRLRWFRGLPHHRVPALLDAVRDSGGVLVSTSNGESFGMTVAEAMARQCPVVVPDRPPFTEFVEDGASGSSFPPGSAEGAADRVQALLADASLRARYGRRGRESVLARFAPEPALAALARELRSLA